MSVCVWIGNRVVQSKGGQDQDHRSTIVAVVIIIGARPKTSMRDERGEEPRNKK